MPASDWFLLAFGILFMAAILAGFKVPIRVRSSFFYIFQVRRLVRRRGWRYREILPRLDKEELFALLIGTGEPPWQERVRIEGTRRGYAFSVSMYEFPELGRSYSETSRSHIDREAVIEVHTPRTIPPERTIWIGPISGKITVEPPIEMPAEFEQWLRKNRRRCRRFSVRSGCLTASIGFEITRGRLLRTLDYLIDAAELWPKCRERDEARAKQRPRPDGLGQTRVDRARQAARRRKR